MTPEQIADLRTMAKDNEIAGGTATLRAIIELCNLVDQLRRDAEQHNIAYDRHMSLENQRAWRTGVPTDRYCPRVTSPERAGRPKAKKLRVRPQAEIEEKRAAVRTGKVHGKKTPEYRKAYVDAISWVLKEKGA